MGFSLRRVRRFAVFVSGRVRRLSGKTRCSVCMKYYKSHNLKVLPHCAHNYCRECLRRTFLRLVDDGGESTVPPRCCGHEITLSITGDFLDGVENPTDTIGLKEKYLQVLEKRTNDPIFCSRGCIKDGDVELDAGLDTKWFITPEEIREEEDLAICGKCKGGTCTLCKMPAPHIAEECGIPDEAEKEEIRYKRLSGKNGWRCCDSCGMMLSRDVGCAHVVCRCGNDVWLAF
ncbi:hypothetical protein P167DRAFT_92366 [Morchella conica CCBAS932]|uniref:RING-type domain-containing protein n=1 Tax=Morchella conica CCBAS932 TaxID=1392247 RepID=A0A3N4KZA5_9PEZI|nr:hypothetical protein P167DRAFT_92366 [Morchella conica CCBAS932]